MSVLDNRKATVFLLPLILEDEAANTILNANYVGCYYKDTNKPHWGEKIFLLYKDSPKNIKIENHYKNSQYKYSKYYETIDGTTYCIYCFIVPPIYKRDYEHIVHGYYSKITNIRHKMVWAWRRSSICRELSMIINLGPRTRNKKGELLDEFDDSEILNLNKVPL